MKAIHLLFFLVAGAATKAQQPVVISAAEKKSIIDTVAARLQRYYVFPDKGKTMSLYLQQRLAAKAYAAISGYAAFIDALNGDLQKAHPDPHMRLVYSPERVGHIRQWESAPQPAGAWQEEMAQAARKENFGFVKTERLPGNIGYLDFRQFFTPTEAARKTVAAAMGFLSHTDALIIDLRNNVGGDPRMVQLMVSYFLDKPVHYNSIYDRIMDSTEQFYALEKVDGSKLPAKDLYLLTSSGTFSGAEEFAYDLQNLHRATIVGETTGGGAHPTRPFIINNAVLMSIPFARAINPFTQTNWEGTGVRPDVAIDASKALLKAQQLILEKALAKAVHPQEKMELEWMRTGYNAILHPVQLSEKELQAYTGTYGERVITLESGTLFYQRGKGAKQKLVPLAADLFQLEGLDYFRAKFVRNAAGIMEKIVGLYDNGEQEESVRSASKPF